MNFNVPAASSELPAVAMLEATLLGSFDCTGQWASPPALFRSR
jgi:hypothetical protein